MQGKSSANDLNRAMEDLLNLEEEFYKEGYEEGLSVKANHNFEEGKQYGLQVGFQRFLLLGEISGYLDVISAEKLDNTALSKNTEFIRSLLAGIRFDNSDEAVADFDVGVSKIRNKFRTILLLLNRKHDHAFKIPLTLDSLENMSSSMGGELKAYVEEGSNDEASVKNGDKQDW